MSKKPRAVQNATGGIETTEDNIKDRTAISRRSFLKTAGMSAGAVGMGALIPTAEASANESSASYLINFAVNTTASPSYMKTPYADVDKLKRFDARKHAFAHPGVKEQVFNGVPALEALLEPGVPKILADEPGFSLIDHSLYKASWVAYLHCPGLMQWEPLGLSRVPEGVPKWEASPENNNNYIKKAAHFFGCGPTGIAELKEQWIYSHEEGGAEIVFSDEHELPVQEDGKWYILKR